VTSSVNSVRVNREDGVTHLSAIVRCHRNEEEVWYRTAAETAAAGETLLAATLSPR